MHRHKKMMGYFMELDEFKEYMATYTGFKRITFEKEVNQKEYTIELKGDGFSPAVVYIKTEAKNLERVEIVDVEKEVKSLYNKIESIRKRCNREYKKILPGQKISINREELVITDIVEDKNNFKQLEKYPTGITLWMDYITSGFKKNVRIQIKNVSDSEEYPIWVEESVKIEGEDKNDKRMLYRLIEEVIIELNKPYRIYSIFEKQKS